MNTEIKEYVEKMKNDTYFTSIVEEYNEEKSVDNFIRLCQVLEYREFYIAGNINISDPTLEKELLEKGNLSNEVLEDKTKFEIEPLRA